MKAVANERTVVIAEITINISIIADMLGSFGKVNFIVSRLRLKPTNNQRIFYRVYLRFAE